MDTKESEFSSIIGTVLRYGVVISFVIVAIGSVLLFLEGQTGYYALGTAEQLFDRHNFFLIGPVPLLEGVIAARPYAIIDLGLIVLLATPIARVFISVFLFLDEKRYAFVLITITVLCLLLFSTFVLGPVLGG
jgi:uncharacterized membrane protein